jgi:hypothetical protein
MEYRVLYTCTKAVLQDELSCGIPDITLEHAAACCYFPTLQVLRVSYMNMSFPKSSLPLPR